MTRRMTERRTASLGALLATIGPISMSLYTPAMPELVHAFATTESAIKLTLSLYFCGFAFAQLVAGPLADAFGRRTATVIFLAIYLVGSLSAAFAPSIEWLLAGRLIQGIGASVGITVARAIVRDQFIGAEAARIMNLVGIMLAIGPAMAPTIGGLTLAAFGWSSIFFLMVGFGLLSCLTITVFMKETIVPNRRRAAPGPLVAAYWELLRDSRFVASALVMGGAVGALYAQSTMLPFILIEKVGLTPTQFGMGMLMQSGSYFTGSVALRYFSRRYGGSLSVRTGLGFIGAGSLIMALSVAYVPPSFLSIMLPVAFYTFGIAFVTPHMTTAGMYPFPHIAGSASALMGFVQMGSGFAAGMLAAAIGIPLTSFGTIIPSMGLMAIASYVWFLTSVRKAERQAASEAAAAIGE
ncbi:multidrug effflux MFS transporter [Sinorhizobium sp. BG8]|uniref:multidrug effflux MFS transporter n=1 Tax=Sinorhizobium sp. BG8 TaxID=2613773 RepID=UPI00193E7A8B|nr:multidrug effflux MFS transporter [Sinorhizobium sp. BG8]QRM53473.1 multidrug effflux MFS transporter [Sinorhizobium sp. BG8]